MFFYCFYPYLASSKNLTFDVWIYFQQARAVTADQITQTQLLLSSSCGSAIPFHVILYVTFLNGLMLISDESLLSGQLLFLRGWPLNRGSIVFCFCQCKILSNTFILLIVNKHNLCSANIIFQLEIRSKPILVYCNSSETPLRGRSTTNDERYEHKHLRIFVGSVSP